MKKNKHETVKNTIPEESENTVKSPNARSKEKNDSEMLFKKVLYGYDPNEVASYINELNNTYESAARMHESKLSSIKEELVLSNRERDFYSEKYKDCQAKLDSSENADTKTDSEKYENIIAELKARCEILEKENGVLKSAENSTSDSGYTDRISSLEAEISDLKAAVEASEHEKAEILKKLQKRKNIVEEYKSVFAQLAESRKDLAEKNALLEEKASETNTLLAETEKIKKQAAELEIKNSVLIQRVNENEDEILRLKDENKIKAFEHTEKINSLEAEHAKDKLAMQKELKLYGYYVDRAELTLDELTKQIEQIKQSLGSAQGK